MDSSRDLYNFAGDTTSDGTSYKPDNYGKNNTVDSRRTSEALNHDAYSRQDILPPAAPDRHKCEDNLLQSKDGRPIIIEYNNIFINSARQQDRQEAAPESSWNRRDIRIPSTYSNQYGQTDNNSSLYRTDQIYPPSQAPEIIYGAPAYNLPSGYGGFGHPPDRAYLPDYANHPCAPYSPRYPYYAEQPPCPRYPSYPDRQNYPAQPNYPSYPVFPNGNYNCSPPSFIPRVSNGKFDEIASILREMGPLAFDITALTTARRGFHHYPGSYVQPYNYYGWNNNVANTIPVNPYGVPLLRY